MSVINIISLPRSGHNAIIYWLLAQKNSKYLGHGDVETINREWRGYSIDKFKNDSIIHLQKYDIDFLEDVKQRLLSSVKNNNLVILDNLITHQNSINILPNNFVLNHKDMINIVIIRSWYNNYASLLKLTEREHFQFNWKPIWIAQAKEALEITNHLPNKIVILYDKWITDIKYRQEICKKLNLPFNDIGHYLVPITGGGSSFDNNTYASNASQMKVLERYKLYEDNKNWFQSIDQEIVDLNIKLFKMYAPTRFNHLNPRWYQIRKNIHESFVDWLRLCRECIYKCVSFWKSNKMS